MFDIGFLELLVIAVIGLLVIGPERLPGAIKSGARTLAKLKRLAGQARAELENELGVDEIRQDLHNEQVLKSLQQLKNLQQQGDKELQELLDDEEEFYCPDHHHSHPEEQIQTKNEPDSHAEHEQDKHKDSI